MRNHLFSKGLMFIIFFFLFASLSYGATVNVSAQDFVFSPSTVTINVGDTVTWTSIGGMHTTTSGSGCTSNGMWDSGTLSPSFSFTFNTAGTYPYFCSFHCASFGMVGTVVVNGPGAMLTLNKSGTGNVTVTSAPAGINCGTMCSTTFALGTSVMLTETPDAGTTFTGWSGGGCKNAAPACNVTTNAPQSVTAHSLISGTTTFSDVSSTDFFEGYIEAIFNNGITTGTSPTTYSPLNNVTREQMAAFLVRGTQVATNQAPEAFTCNGGVAGQSVDCSTTTPYFADVPSTDPFFKYVQKLKELAITTGTSPTTYSPANLVTREQMAAFLVRATQVSAGLPPEGFTCNGGVAGQSVDCSTTTAYFADVPSTDLLFKYVQKLKELGITTGTSPTTYSPLNDVTREQMAAFISRAFLGMP